MSNMDGLSRKCCGEMSPLHGKTVPEKGFAHCPLPKEEGVPTAQGWVVCPLPKGGLCAQPKGEGLPNPRGKVCPLSRGECAH